MQLDGRFWAGSMRDGPVRADRETRPDPDPTARRPGPGQIRADSEPGRGGPGSTRSKRIDNDVVGALWSWRPDRD